MLPKAGAYILPVLVVYRLCLTLHAYNVKKTCLVFYIGFWSKSSNLEIGYNLVIQVFNTIV